MRLGNFIACVDVGFCNTGVAIFDLSKDEFVHAEVIRTSKGEFNRKVSLDNFYRCQKLFKRLSVLREQYKFKEVAAELPHGGALSSRAMAAMALSSAVLACFVGRYKLRFNHISPIQIKRMVSPNGKSVEKQQVMAYASSRFGEKHLPKTLALREHIADAMVCIDVLKYGTDQARRG